MLCLMLGEGGLLLRAEAGFVLSLGGNWVVVIDFGKEVLDSCREVRLCNELGFDVGRWRQSKDPDGRKVQFLW